MLHRFMRKKCLALVLLLVIMVVAGCAPMDNLQKEYERNRDQARQEKNLRNKQGAYEDSNPRNLDEPWKVEEKDKEDEQKKAEQEKVEDKKAPIGTKAANASEIAGPVVSSLMLGKNHNADASAYAYPAWLVQAWLIYGVDAHNTPGKKLCFLTFDDGPSATNTANIVNILNEKGAVATFFQVGQYVKNADPSLMKHIIDSGHAISIHTQSHQYGYLYPGRYANVNNIVADYDQANYHLKSVLGNGYKSQSIRYPGGHMSWKGMAPADAALAKKGWQWIDWNEQNGDANGRPLNEYGILQTVYKGHRDKMVVVLLMHDAETKKNTAKALPGIIDYYRAQGYEFAIIE